MTTRPAEYWASRERRYADGSWQTYCYWCAEPLLVYQDDAVSVAMTVAGEFAGVQCESCSKKQAGVHAPYPRTVGLPEVS